MNRLLDHLRRVLEEPLGDADLLDRFIERREETAFTALLKRHGPMVFGVCQRILGNFHDAEEAFQATFLVLARKATSVQPRVAVGAWLYGVAYRTALEARTKITRRRSREIQVDELPEPEVSERSVCRELLSLLDREVHRLPDKYRVPVVLCDLEGRSRKEVARQLSIPEGTLSSRLAAAHKRLAWRLSRFGLTVTGAMLAQLAVANAASAHVPVFLAGATTKAAMLLTAGQTAGVSAGVLALTEGVLRTMFIAKAKTVSLVLCGVATLGLGTGGFFYQTRVGAADSPGSGQKLVSTQDDDNSNGRSAPQDKDRAKLAAEEARLTASLRAELEKARKEAEMQRQRAEAALIELKEQLAKARQAEMLARQQAQKALYASTLSQAQRVPGREQTEPQAAERLNELEARTRERFQKERQELMERLKRLEQQEVTFLQKLQSERFELKKQQDRKQTERTASSGDKLDRILERLERMERRLDKLEQGRKP